MERRLSAILAADVVGYSRLMSQDEAGTLVSVQAHFNNVVLPTIERHDGHLINIMGDGILAHFPSAVSAAECGVAIQRTMQDRILNTSPKCPIVFRMGINLGDIIISAEGVHGHHINIAARLEQGAKPGSINISHAVFEASQNRTSYEIRELGPQTMKNMGIIYVFTQEPHSPIRGILRLRRLHIIPFFLGWASHDRPRDILRRVGDRIRHGVLYWSASAALFGRFYSHTALPVAM